MSHDILKDKIAFELAAIRQELDATGELFSKLRLYPPDNIEIRAAAGTLHAFYNGVENIFVAVSRHVDGTVPETGHWHSNLLKSMSRATPLRPEVIDDVMLASLEMYLSFRHFYRHTYGFVLDWDQMKPLCDNLNATYERFSELINCYNESL